MLSTLTRCVLAGLVAVLAALAAATPAHAAFGIASFTTDVSDQRAGGHPDATVAFALNTKPGPSTYPLPDEGARDIVVELPPGLIGNPHTAKLCTPAQLTDTSNTACPPESQVGINELVVGLSEGPPQTLKVPVYNMVPEGGEPATFAFVVNTPRVQIHTAIRATDRGLTTTIRNLNRAARLYSAKLTLWGVPADPSHAPDRWCPAGYSPASSWNCPSTATPKPFMRNPTACEGEPLVTTLRVRSWQSPDVWKTAETVTPHPHGCEDQPFEPTVTATPDTTSIDTPTGLTVDVKVPQNESPTGVASADLRKAVVTLPEGLTLSPGVSDGLQACTPAQFGRTSEAAPACPDASVLGWTEIASPLVPDPLEGKIYMGPADQPGRYQVYVDASTDGVRLKLIGDITPDPQTGRLTATFDDNPQLPFTDFRLHFDGGPRAALATPAVCGTGAASSVLTSWAAPALAPVRFDDQPIAWGAEGQCGEQPFTPAFAAGTTDPGAGKRTALTVQLAREDRTQQLGQIASVRLPQGLMADVGSVPRCAAAAAATGACPEASRIGKVVVGSGPGAAPLHLGGTAYLTDGYKGAPFGMALVIRAIAGPIDLGTVVVRSAIRVTPDARIEVETDPLPQMLGGIPLRLRSVELTLDRPGFVVNPTSCEPAQIAATLKSTTGTSVDQSSRFQAADCGALPFAPKLVATATEGKGKTPPAGLNVKIGQASGEANMRSVTVDVPKQLAVRLEALGGMCSTAQLDANACPASAKVGTATAVTSILATPLTGPVVLVDAGTPLPKLAALLAGDGIALRLEGDTALTKRNNLRTIFGSVPDVPLSSFELDLPATGNAVLQAAAGLPCEGLRIGASYVAHNGAKRSAMLPVKVPCTAAAWRPTVTSQTLTGRALVLKLSVRGAGRIVVRGAGLRTTKRTVKQAGAVTVRVPLTALGARTVRAKDRFAGKVRISQRLRSRAVTSRVVDVRVATTE